MPELPEVETIRRSLEKNLSGKIFLQVDIFLARQIKWPDIDDFTSRVVGRTISALERKGKYLIIVLDNGNRLIFHLRMTGRLCYYDSKHSFDIHDRLVFQLSDKGELVYNDVRTFGVIYALQQDELWRLSGMAEMGPEPLSAKFTPAYLQKAAQGKHTKIKSFLLDQRQIAGLGNIYADEALFLAGIYPTKQIGTLSEEEITRLHRAINQVIADGIHDGGTTFRDYRDGNGEKGHHQDKLQVYHKDGEPCPRCGNTLCKIIVAGRSSHFCPVCQPKRE